MNKETKDNSNRLKDQMGVMDTKWHLVKIDNPNFIKTYLKARG